MRSRVIPGSLVTMARRVPVRRLKSVDLPTLGRPTITRDGSFLVMDASRGTHRKTPAAVTFHFNALEERSERSAARVGLDLFSDLGLRGRQGLLRGAFAGVQSLVGAS